MKFSIVTVCFNSEKTIKDTIDSIKSQTYKNIEYILVDGGSSDSTNEIIGNYSDIVSCHIIEKDKGIYDAMNKGLCLATGDVICILNSDDFYPHVDVISQVAQAFKDNPDVDMVLGNVDFVRPDNLDLPIRFYSSFNFEPWKMRFGFMPAHPAAFIKASAYKKVGSYALGYKIGADFEWFVRAFLIRRLSYVKLNKTLVRMREGGVSTSGLKSYWLSSKEQLRALRSNRIHSTLLCVMMRLPIKFFQKLIIKK